MALTPSQITQIRNKIGDTNTAAPDLDDTRLNTIFSEQSSDFGATILEAAYERAGILSNEVDERGQIQDELRSQRFKHLIERIIPRLEGLYGASSDVYPQLQAGSLDLGIGTEYDDLDID